MLFTLTDPAGAVQRLVSWLRDICYVYARGLGFITNQTCLRERLNRSRSAPKEQLPRKLSGKRTADMNTFRRAADNRVSRHTEGASGRFR